jgi:hypothetical protein
MGANLDEKNIAGPLALQAGYHRSDSAGRYGGLFGLPHD